MSSEYRVFRPEFREHMTLADAWPKPAALRAWLQARGVRGIRNGICRGMEDGKAQPERYLAKLIDYLRQTREIKRDPDKLQETLYAFLRKSGAADPAALQLPEIMELVSEPAAPSFTDAFMEGIGVIKAAFDRVRSPTSCVEFCQSPDDVREAIRWMFVELGRLMSRERLNIAQSIVRGEARIGTSLSDYQNRAIEWWRAEPWTVVFTRGYRRPAGMSIALPLTVDAYESVLRGEKRTYWCTPADFCRPSSCIVVEGMTMRPPEEGLEGDAKNLRLLIAMLCQQAHLSDMPGLGREFPLRLLTFAAAPRQRQRAIKFDYQPTGKFMHGTDAEFLERRLLTKKRGVREWALWGIWTGVQDSTAKMVTPQAADQPRS